MDLEDDAERGGLSHGVFERGAPGGGLRSVRLPNGVRLTYLERGPSSGRTIVLLHGLSDSCRSFEPLIRHLPSSWRVIAVTQRGHGGSDQPDAGYEVTDLAADLAALLDVLHVPAPLLVCHSLGASVVRQLVLDRPTRGRSRTKCSSSRSGRARPCRRAPGERWWLA